MFRFPRVYLVTGSRNGASGAFSILYTGGDTNRNYIAHMAFGEAYTEKKLGHLWIWQWIAVVIKMRKTCSIIVFEGNYRLFKVLPMRNFFYIPDWINGEVRIDDDTGNMKKMNRKLLNNVRRIIKNDLTYEICTEERCFEHFYHRMYIPYIGTRFTDRACIREMAVLKEDFRNGELLTVKKDGVAIAGVILKYNEHGDFEMTRLGILDGDAAYVKMGALSAVYYYTMLYAKSKGYARVDVGGSRPFLNDGVLNYKRTNWNMRLKGFYKNGIMMKLLTLNPGAKQFLVENPFIGIVDGQPFGVVFESCEEPNAASCTSWNEGNIMVDGLRGMICYVMEEKRQPLLDMVSGMNSDSGVKTTVYNIGVRD